MFYPEKTTLEANLKIVLLFDKTTKQ